MENFAKTKIQKSFLEAVELYIRHPSKAGIFNIVHRHGNEGIKRAKLLQQYISASDDFAQLHQLITNYLNRSPNLESILSVINPTALQTQKNNTKSKIDAIFLKGGNKNPSSLWSYINNLFQKINTVAASKSSLFDTNHPIFKVFLQKEDIACIGSATVKSAHAVTRYQDKHNNTDYFVKSLAINNKKDIENAIAEVFYAQIWNYFIGERASKSLLLLSQNKIVGIASQGLKDFRAYNTISGEEKNSIGLISILFYVYVLIENDFHICNFGISKVKGIFCYSKIDHDYIISFWGDLKSKGYMEVSLGFLKLLKTRAISDCFGLLESMRFSPAKANSGILNAAHHIRSNKPVTTTSRNMANQFRAHAITPSNQQELSDTIDDFIFRIRPSEIHHFFVKLEAILTTEIAPMVQFDYQCLAKSYKLLSFFKIRFLHIYHAFKNSYLSNNNVQHKTINNSAQRSLAQRKLVTVEKLKARYGSLLKSQKQSMRRNETIDTQLTTQNITFLYKLAQAFLHALNDKTLQLKLLKRLEKQVELLYNEMFNFSDPDLQLKLFSALFERYNPEEATLADIQKLFKDTTISMTCIHGLFSVYHDK